MFSLPWKKRLPPTGLDCGQAWAKLVGFRRSKQGVSLERIGRMPWTGQDRESPQHMARKLAALYSGLQLDSGPVITSLAGHSVIMKRLNLPQQQIKDLPGSLPDLAGQHIPFDIQDVCLDYQILDQDHDHDSTTLLLVASKKKVVHETQDILSQADLETHILDVDGFAVCNCFEFNYPDQQDTSVALLDIGAHQSTFCVVAQRCPLFLRDAGFGGQQITERLVQQLDLSSVQAETMKWQTPDALPADIRTYVEQEMRAIFVSWTEEIRRLLHYYSNSQPVAPSPPKRLYLSGGGSLHPGLDIFLNEHLDFETAYLDPWRHCHIDDSRFDLGYLHSIGPQFAVSAGLALRGVW